MELTGSLKFYFETGGLDIKPKILEDGRVRLL